MHTHEYYEAISLQDTPADGPHGWIQWKGTEVCIDLYCPCGHHGHVDAEFFYTYRCKCGVVYAVGSAVKLIKLTPEQVNYLKENE